MSCGWGGRGGGGPAARKASANSSRRCESAPDASVSGCLFLPRFLTEWSRGRPRDASPRKDQPGGDLESRSSIVRSPEGENHVGAHGHGRLEAGDARLLL